MANKLARYCEGVIEATWLAVVVVVPLFFNRYSSLIFSPDKVVLLRSLALLILAAWLIKALVGLRADTSLLSEFFRRVQSWFRIPLLVSILGLVVAYLVAMVFSVTPEASLWGSYQRQQGITTSAAYLVVFTAMAVHLRRLAQVRRLVTMVVMVSLPISLYGVLQHYNLDPFLWDNSGSMRISANLGNPVYLAGYLIMVIPLTVISMMHAMRDVLYGEANPLVSMLSGAAYLFLLALQLLALYFSGSRGPWLGWLIGSFFLALWMSLYWRRRSLTVAILLAALLGGLLSLSLVLSSGSKEGLLSRSPLGRLQNLANAEDSSGRVRIAIWQSVSQLVLSPQPLVFPDESQDRNHAWRPWIGYGPESMGVVFHQIYPTELAHLESRYTIPDRLHNETWDAFVSTGFVGLAAYLTLFVCIFYSGVRWLGMVKGRWQRHLFWALCLGGCLVGAAASGVLFGLAYLGLGLPLGLLAGMGFYLLVLFLSNRKSPTPDGAEGWAGMIIIAVLAAIAGHLVEIQFGFATETTRTYFWAYAGLLIAVGRFLPQEAGLDRLPRAKTGILQAGETAGAGPTKAVDLQTSWITGGLAAGALLAVVLITLGFDFLSTSIRDRSPWEIVWHSMLWFSDGQGPVSGIPLVVLFTWLVGGLLLVNEGIQLRQERGRVKAFIMVLGISALLAVFFWFWHAEGVLETRPRGVEAVGEALERAEQGGALIDNFALYFGMAVLFAGALLPVAQPVQIGLKKPAGLSLLLKGSWPGMVGVPLVLLVLVFLVQATQLRSVRADMVVRLADFYAVAGQWSPALALYDRAIHLAPGQDSYYLFHARAVLEQAKATVDPVERDLRFLDAEQLLQKAQAFSPLDSNHTANLGRLYREWAALSTDPRLRSVRADRAGDFFSSAVRMRPNDPLLWSEWADLYLTVLGQPQKAFPLLTMATEIDPDYDRLQALWGDYAMRLAKLKTEGEAKRRNLYRAVIHYRRALELARTRDYQSKYTYTLAMAKAQTLLHQPRAAIAAYRQALEFMPSSPENWSVEEQLAALYVQIEQPEQALTHAHLALNLAPEEHRTRLQSVAARIEAQLK